MCAFVSRHSVLCVSTINGEISSSSFDSLQESWGQFVDVCSTISNEKTQDPLEWLSSKDAVDLLASSDVIQTSSCPYEPIALNCFLNNVVSL